MLRPSPHTFAFPVRRVPGHRLPLAAAAIGIAAAAASFAPGAGALLTDEDLAHALPVGLGLLALVLVGVLAWAGRRAGEA